MGSVGRQIFSRNAGALNMKCATMTVRAYLWQGRQKRQVGQSAAAQILAGECNKVSREATQVFGKITGARHRCEFTR